MSLISNFYYLKGLATPQERFHSASSMSVNGKTSKKSIAKRHEVPCFSLNFYRLSTTRCGNALGVFRSKKVLTHQERFRRASSFTVNLKEKRQDVRC